MRTVGAFWIGAGLALLALVGGAIWLAGRTRVAQTPAPPVVAAPPAAKAADVPSSPPSEAPSAAAPIAEPTAAPSEAEPVEALALPETAARTGEPKPASTKAPVAAPPAARDTKRARREPHRQNDAPGVQQRIPGERTKGFSVDEF
jgi:hypothetical protein